MDQQNLAPKFCGTCGTPLLEGGRFCPGCGSAIQSLPIPEPAPSFQAVQQMPAEQTAPAVGTRHTPSARRGKSRTGLWVGLLGVLLVAIIAVTLALLLQPKHPEKIRLDQSALTMTVGQWTTLECQILPREAKDKSADWSTSDARIATVKNGEVQAKGVGTCTITATTENGLKAHCTVKVEEVAVKSLTLSQTEISLYVGQQLTLTCQSAPEQADAVVIWTSDNGAVAGVQEGTVTARGVGECNITVTAQNDVSTSAHVTVILRPEEELPCGKWSLNRITDPYAQQWGATVVLNEDLTGTLDRSGVTTPFAWRFNKADTDGEYWYDVTYDRDEAPQLIYSREQDMLTLYWAEESWIFTRSD